MDQILSIKKIFNDAWVLYSANFKKFYISFNIVFLPFSLIPCAVLASGTSYNDLSPCKLLLFHFFNIVSFSLIPISNCVLIRILFKKIEGQKESIISAYSFAARSFWRLFKTHILCAIFIGIGSIFFIIPGIILLIKYFFIFQILVKEKLSPFESLNKSASIAGKNFGLATK